MGHFSVLTHRATSAGESFEDLLDALPGGLTQEQVTSAFDRVVTGEVSDVQVAAFLFGLRTRGETAADVRGIVDALLKAAPTVPLDGLLLDIVGTGGDRTGTISISTPASVVASAVADRATVVKHGNRGASTPTGSADVIEAWGIPLNLTPDQVAEVGERVGITFCFAARFHPAMRHVATARKALNVSTVMNLIGPLINPARPSHQLIGVADESCIELMAEAVRKPGKRTLFAHGADGLDKITVTGPTRLTLVNNEDSVTTFEFRPEEVGLGRSPIAELLGSTPAENAGRLLRVLSGDDRGAVRDAVVLNAAAAVALADQIAGPSPEEFLRAMASKARCCEEAIDSGAALKQLHCWVRAATEVSRLA